MQSRPAGEVVLEADPAPRLNEPSPDRPRTEHHAWTIGGKTYRLCYGDLHRHTEFSNCRTSGDGCVLEHFRYAVDIVITAQEILVDFSGYPTESIGRNSHDYRPLGLGYANLGALLKAAQLAPSTTEALRLVDQGGVRVDAQAVSDRGLKLPAGTYVVQVGKRKFARVTLS